MKAVLLLLVAMAVAANGLGFPNFNLGCPFGQAGRFVSTSTTGVIPYCRVSNDRFINDLSQLLQARPGYTPVYEAVNDWVIIRPEVTLSQLDGLTIGQAFPGIVVSIGAEAEEQFEMNSNTHFASIMVGAEVGFTFAGCTTLDRTRINGATFGLGLTQLVACPSENILGHFEFANRAGGSNQGRAQSVTLPRPYIFYGL